MRVLVSVNEYSSSIETKQWHRRLFQIVPVHTYLSAAPIASAVYRVEFHCCEFTVHSLRRLLNNLFRFVTLHV